jgi:hypothetical protein
MQKNTVYLWRWLLTFRRHAVVFMVDPKDEGMFLQKVGIHFQDYTVLYTRKTHSEHSVPWKPNNLKQDEIWKHQPTR